MLTTSESKVHISPKSRNIKTLCGKVLTHTEWKNSSRSSMASYKKSWVKLSGSRSHWWTSKMNRKGLILPKLSPWEIARLIKRRYESFSTVASFRWSLTLLTTTVKHLRTLGISSDIAKVGWPLGKSNIEGRPMKTIKVSRPAKSSSRLCIRREDLPRHREKSNSSK